MVANVVKRIMMQNRSELDSSLELHSEESPIIREAAFRRTATMSSSSDVRIFWSQLSACRYLSQVFTLSLTARSSCGAR